MPRPQRNRRPRSRVVSPAPVVRETPVRPKMPKFHKMIIGVAVATATFTLPFFVPRSSPTYERLAEIQRSKGRPFTVDIRFELLDCKKYEGVANDRIPLRYFLLSPSNTGRRNRLINMLSGIAHRRMQGRVNLDDEESISVYTRLLNAGVKDLLNSPPRLLEKQLPKAEYAKISLMWENVKEREMQSFIQKIERDVEKQK